MKHMVVRAAGFRITTGTGCFCDPLRIYGANATGHYLGLVGRLNIWGVGKGDEEFLVVDSSG